MKRALALILALVMTMALVACGGDKTTSTPSTSTPATTTPSTTTPSTTEPSKPADPTPTTPAEPEKPAEPKILYLAQSAAAGTCYPAVSSATNDSSVYVYIHARLYRVQPKDGKPVLLPNLADGEPIDVNGDGLTWNIKINPEAKWDNGDPINADTFLYSWKMGLDPKLVFANAGRIASNSVTVVNGTEYYEQGAEGKPAVAWEDVGFKKVDDLTIQVQLTSKATALMVMQHFSASSTVPVYQPLFEKCLSADGTSCTYGTSLETIACSGPLKLTNWVIGSVREYEKNENYIDADSIKLDKLVQYVVADAGTQQQMFEKGELDYLSLSVDAQKQYGDDPRIIYVPSRHTRSLEFCTTNTEKPILNNANFRLALYYATDRVSIAKLSGDQPGAGVIHVPVGDADGTLFREMAEKAGYMPANNGYDPVKAKEYFDKALKEEGLTSLEVTLTYNSATSDNSIAAEFVQESWVQIFGADRFKLVLEPLPSAQFNQKIKAWKTDTNAYEICVNSWSVALGDMDPLRALYVYTSTHSNRNAPYGSDTYLEGLYAEGYTDENRLDLDKRTELALKMEQHMLENATIVPILYDNSAAIMSDRVVLAVETYDLDLGWGWMYADIIQ